MKRIEIFGVDTVDELRICDSDYEHAIATMFIKKYHLEGKIDEETAYEIVSDYGYEDEIQEEFRHEISEMFIEEAKQLAREWEQESKYYEAIRYSRAI